MIERKYGASIPFFAAENGHIGVLELLRDAGSSLQTPNMDGVTPAGLAAHNGRVAALELFRDAKVNLEIPDKNGVTPALRAAANGHVAVWSSSGTPMLILRLQICVARHRLGWLLKTATLL